jgi:hypothetical protein
MRKESLEAAVSSLDDQQEYTLFLVGTGRHGGSFRIDRTTGSQIKHLHLIFEYYNRAEIYHNEYEPRTEMHSLVEKTVVHKIEHAIKESYYGLPGCGEAGMKQGFRFDVLRIDCQGRYSKEEYSGERLSKELKELIGESKTLTIIERGSRSDLLLQKTLESPGKLKIHRGDKYFSELSPEERARYRIGDDYKTDPFSSPENVLEHHPD